MIETRIHRATGKTILSRGAVRICHLPSLSLFLLGQWLPPSAQSLGHCNTLFRKSRPARCSALRPSGKAPPSFHSVLVTGIPKWRVLPSPVSFQGELLSRRRRYLAGEKEQRRWVVMVSVSELTLSCSSCVLSGEIAEAVTPARGTVPSPTINN